MSRHLTWLALIALAGCNNAGTTPAANGESSTAETTPDTARPIGRMQMRPGEWEMTTEMLDMNIPGMPAGAMLKQMKNTTNFKTCMKDDKPDANFFQGTRNSNCTYKDFSMAGGHVKGTATCDNAGQTMTMTMDGRYGAESYDMTMALKSEQMSMKMHTAGRRIGDCSAS